MSYDGNPHRYEGSGGLKGLIKARSQCYKELSGGSVAGNNNINMSVKVNSGGSGLMSCGAFNACIAEKGYLRTRSGNIDLPDSYDIKCQ